MSPNRMEAWLEVEPSVRRMLAHWPHALRPDADTPLLPLGNAGGLSGARLWKFEGPHGPLVLKRWPDATPTARELRNIHTHLFDAAARGFGAERLPLPFPDRSGRTVVQDPDTGSLWELTRWLPGQADHQRPPALAHLRAAFIALAQLHRLWETDLKGLVGHRRGVGVTLSRRIAELDQWRSVGFAALQSCLDRSELTRPPSQQEPDSTDPPPIITAEDHLTHLDIVTLARRWLEESRRLWERARRSLERASSIPTPLLFVWRDPRPDHILFEQEMVTGLLDFGGAGIDSAAVDLARLLPEWTTNHPSARSEALAAYETIRPLQPSEQRVLEALELSGPIMLGGRWLSWWFLGAPPRSPACLDPRRVLWGLRRALEGLEAVDTSRMIV